MDAMVVDADDPADALGDPQGGAFGRVPEPLKVALIAPPYFDVPPRAYGGVEAVVADLANALVQQGHKVTLIGAGENGTKADFRPVWDGAVPHRLGEAFPEIAHASLTRNAVCELARKQGLDVVHDHTGAGPLNAPYYGTLGIPTVVTAHGPVAGDLYQLCKTLQGDISLVAISHRQRELAADLPWVATVHNGLWVADWPYRAAKEDYALFLGRFHADKGAHLALDAAERGESCDMTTLTAAGIGVVMTAPTRPSIVGRLAPGRCVPSRSALEYAAWVVDQASLAVLDAVDARARANAANTR